MYIISARGGQADVLALAPNVQYEIRVQSREGERPEKSGLQCEGGSFW